MSPQSNKPVFVAKTEQDQTAQSAIILLPFNSKVASKAKVEERLRQLIAQATSALALQLPKAELRQMVQHMEKAAAQLDYTTRHQSLALFATPHEAHIDYWSVAVPETVSIGDDFNLLEVLYQSTEPKEYLLLTMGRHHAGIYLGNENKLSRLVANSPNSTQYSSATEAQPDVIDQAVRHIDNALTILRRAYHLPLVVAASALYIDTFKKLSPNAGSVAAFITNAHTDNDRELRTALQPFLADWQNMKERELLAQLEAATQAGKVVFGAEEVWAAANQKRIKQLIIERDFRFPAYIDKEHLKLYADVIPINRPSMSATDAAEESALQVLNSGGQVAVVGNDLPDEYLHIAAICY